MTDSDSSANSTFNGPIDFMARNPIAANLLMIILLGGGIWSAFVIQKEVFPQFQLDIVEISVAYPGAAPTGYSGRWTVTPRLVNEIPWPDLVEIITQM